MDASAHVQLLAQVTEKNLPDYFPPARYFTISSFANLLIPILLTGAGLLLLVMLFMGAFKIITAGCNPENIDSARRLFFSAIIGFFIVIFSFVIVKILGYILHVEVFT